MKPLCAKRRGAAPHPNYAVTFLGSPPNEIACSTGAQLNAYRPVLSVVNSDECRARPDSRAPVEAALNPAATPPSFSTAPARTPAPFGSAPLAGLAPRPLGAGRGLVRAAAGQGRALPPRRGEAPTGRCLGQHGGSKAPTRPCNDSNPAFLGNECRNRVAMVMLLSNSGECSSQPARRARRQRTRKACGLARNRRVRGQQGRFGDSARDRHRPRVVRELRTSTFQFDSSIHSPCANSAD